MYLVNLTIDVTQLSLLCQEFITGSDCLKCGTRGHYCSCFLSFVFGGFCFEFIFSTSNATRSSYDQMIDMAMQYILGLCLPLL